MTLTPFYRHYPQDPAENLRWRVRCRERALEDIRFRHALYDACMEDVLFFMGFAMWSLEPRARVKVRPFIPWPHQEKVFVAMDRAIDDSANEEKTIDVLVDKSRAQGGTFGYLWVDLRRWLRDPMFSAGYVTRNEALVDSATDADTLFWKLAWAIERLPFWMLPRGFEMKRHRSLSGHSLLNPANGSTLVGYAAGQDVAAGGRKTVFTCLAGGTLVVTDRGLVPIEEVALFHRVWDGTMWVNHDGLVYQGERETISAYGIGLTLDHRVLTEDGWNDASDRIDRAEVWIPDRYQEEWASRQQHSMAVPVQMRGGSDGVLRESPQWRDQELRLLSANGNRKQGTDARPLPDEGVSGMGQDASAVPEPEVFGLQVLRGPWHYGMRPMAGVRELPCRYGEEAGGADAGEERQHQRLRARQLQVGNSPRAGQQYPPEPCGGNIAGPSDSGPNSEDSGNDRTRCETPHQEWLDGGRASKATQTPEAVYDLLNCGPRRAFTVIDDHGRPLLVHNCDEFGAKDFISGGKDESVMESLHDVTNCIRLVSARYADAGVFHEACQDPDHSGIHLILDWKDNPIHAKHSYVVRDGRPEARKPEDQDAVDAYHAENPDLQRRLERRGFKWEGVVRSPWYDMRCLRPTATPRLIASQLDRDPRGAVGKVFPGDLLDRVKRKHCKPPVWRGTPVFDSETLVLKGLVTREDGPLKLWFRPGPDHSCPLGPFILGCDIAVGSDGAYSSNSVASGIDDRTGEQMLEYTVKGMPSIKFARNVVGLARWLRRAYLGWEDSGMAGPFAKEILEVLYYGNVYYREVAEIGVRRKTRKAGWWNGKDDDKADLFEKMALAMEMGAYTIRSEDLIRECGEYEWEKGKIIHQPTKNRGATEKAHGDRCIAGGVAWLLYSEGFHGIGIDKDVESGETPEYGSFLWREQREQNRVEPGGPAFGLKDVVRP